jgi:hypothetical protein
MIFLLADYVLVLTDRLYDLVLLFKLLKIEDVSGYLHNVVVAHVADDVPARYSMVVVWPHTHIYRTVCIVKVLHLLNQVESDLEFILGISCGNKRCWCCLLLTYLS